MERNRNTLNRYRMLFRVIVGMCCAAVIVSGSVQGRATEKVRVEEKREPTETTQSQTEPEESFHMTFQKGLEAYLEDGSLVTGDKAVCLEYESGHEDEAVYTKDHVLVQYLAEKPEEVRYLVRYATGKKTVGKYSITGSALGIGGGAYQLYVWIEIEDLKTGETLAKQQFMGSPPPESIKVRFGQLGGTASGDPPDEKEMQKWVATELIKAQSAALAAREATEATEPEWDGEEALKAVSALMKKGWNSYEDLIWALEHEGFTHEGAVYAADNCGANWKLEALKDARKAMVAGVSKEELLEFLESGGFTKEEIAYAVEKCGIK